MGRKVRGKQDESATPVLGNGVPDGATEVKITSISKGGEGAQITVAFRDPETKERKSATLHLRRHAGRWEDRFGRAWALFTGPQDLPKSRAEFNLEVKAKVEAERLKAQ